MWTCATDNSIWTKRLQELVPAADLTGNLVVGLTLELGTFPTLAPRIALTDTAFASLVRRLFAISLLERPCFHVTADPVTGRSSRLFGISTFEEGGFL